MRRSLALVLLLASPALGQAPPTPPAPTPVFPVATITAPASHPGGVPLVLFSDQSVSASKVTWVLISPKGTYETYYKDKPADSEFCVRQPLQGVTYRVALMAFGSKQADEDRPVAFDIVDVPVGIAPLPGPTPPPKPNPDPPAPPAPVPVTLSKPFWVELVYDATPSKVTPTTRSMINSFELESVAREAGGYYQPIATQSADFARRNLGKYVGVGTGLIPTPALIVRDAKGEKILGELAPKDERAMMDRLKALIGGAP